MKPAIRAHHRAETFTSATMAEAKAAAQEAIDVCAGVVEKIHARREGGEYEVTVTWRME